MNSLRADPTVSGGRPAGAALGLRAVTWMIPLVLLGLAFSAWWLAQRGASEFLDSTGGRIQELVTDPFAPGYEALVDPTPSLLVVLEADDGGLAAAAIVTRDPTASGGGGVLVFPGIVEIDDSQTLIDLYAGGDTARVHDAMATLVNAAIDDVVVLDASAWIDLYGDDGPIPIVIPDRLVTRDAVGTASLTFESGPGTIEPEYAPLYVGWRNPDENVFVYLSRQFGFWEASFSALAESGVDANGSPLTEMLSIVLAGDYEIREVDYEVDPGGNLNSADSAMLNVDRFGETMADLLPFPRQPARGERPRVRLLDGVGDRDALVDYSTLLVRAGAQITVIGNASDFETESTRVVVHDRSATDDAQRFVDSLGAGRIETDIPDTALEDAPETIFDVTVVIGTDASN